MCVCRVWLIDWFISLWNLSKGGEFYIASPTAAEPVLVFPSLKGILHLLFGLCDLLFPFACITHGLPLPLLILGLTSLPRGGSKGPRWTNVVWVCGIFVLSQWVCRSRWGTVGSGVARSRFLLQCLHLFVSSIPMLARCCLVHVCPVLALFSRGWNVCFSYS